MKTFLKGIVVGLGASSPGLSGSVLLVMFGLYQKTIDAISTIFKHFKKNLLFLIPLALGMGVGLIAFSKVIDLLLEYFPTQTHYGFLGLILGTVPLFYKEVKKEGFPKKYYLFILVAFCLGGVFFVLNRESFPNVTDPNFFQSMLLGLTVAVSYIVPGVDSAAILSAFGLYELWVDSLANLNLGVLLPAAIGAACGVMGVSLLVSYLTHKWYTGTFSVIFGLFLSVVLDFILDTPLPGLDWTTLASVICLILGIAVSLSFSNLEGITAWLKARKKTQDVPEQ